MTNKPLSPSSDTPQEKAQQETHREMTFAHAIGKFVMSYELLMFNVRFFFLMCYGIEHRDPKETFREEFNRKFARRPDGKLKEEITDIYKRVRPNDTAGQKALSNFKAVLADVIDERVDLLHSNHLLNLAEAELASIQTGSVIKQHEDFFDFKTLKKYDAKGLNEYTHEINKLAVAIAVSAFRAHSNESIALHLGPLKKIHSPGKMTGKSKASVPKKKRWREWRGIW